MTDRRSKRTANPYSEEELGRALHQRLQAELRDVPDEAEAAASHRFSPRFKQRMAGLMRSPSRRIKPAGCPAYRLNAPLLHRVAAIAVVIVLLFGAYWTTEAGRPKITGFETVRRGDWLEIIFEQRDGESLKPGQTQDPRPQPASLPGGFVQINQDRHPTMSRVVYRDGDGKKLVYSRANRLDATMSLNPEAGRIQELKIDGRPAISFTDGLISELIWVDDHMVATLDGQCDLQVLIAIAEFTLKQ